MFEFIVAVASLLVALVAGLLLVFAIVVMPGLGRLDDGDFLGAFKAIDRVIQDGQPVFVAVWGGSILAVLAAAALSVRDAEGPARMLVLGAAGIYLLGVQVSTFVYNIPLNNRLQVQDLDAMTAQELAAARASFEPKWNLWNRVRTVSACAAATLLLAALAQV